MQNLNNSSYINKVINIKSEILFREAEDDFYYFNKINSAYSKLKKAISLTPYHLKSLTLLADISYMKGFYNKALELYKKAQTLSPKEAKITASISNCLYAMKENEEALVYCDKALSLINNDEFSLYSQLMEIKVNLLVNLKKYKQAYITFIQAQNILDSNAIKNLYNTNYEIINEKLKLQKKLKQSNLKIV